jgi:hypothetical protein
MLTFGPRPWEAFSTEINRLVDDAAEIENKTRQARDYLGASRIGEECLRKLGYELWQMDRDEGRGFPGRILRIFERGHDAETRVVLQLVRAGWDIVRGNADDPRLKFRNARFAGHADGLVLSGPPVGGLSYPCLLELKCLNSTTWGGIEKVGLHEGHWEYWAQVQIYMAYLGYTQCLWIAENANTCQLYAEVVPVNLREAQELSDKAAKVLAATFPEELPRAYRSRTHSNCRWCHYQDRCWSEPAPEPAASPAGVPDWVRRLRERGNPKQENASE